MTVKVYIATESMTGKRYCNYLIDFSEDPPTVELVNDNRDADYFR